MLYTWRDKKDMLAEQIYQKRSFIVKEELANADIDAFVIFSIDNSDNKNLYYFSGFRGSTGAIVVLKDKEDPTLIIDGRYITQAKQQSSIPFFMCAQHSLMQTLLSFLGDNCVKRVALIFDRLYTSRYIELKEKLNVKLFDFSDVVKALRRKKEPYEVNYIKRAYEIAKKAFYETLNEIRPGIKEIELSALLEYKIKCLGGEGGWDNASFIVASGLRSVLPHAKPTDKTIKEHEIVTVDFGVSVCGYVCDITRNFSFGDVSLEVLKIHEAVYEAKKQAERHLKARIEAKSLDKVARDYIEDANFGDYFLHGLGHGLGLDVHEAPYISSKSTDILEVGDVITIEPGIYVPDVGGIRVEDDYLVKEDGFEKIIADFDENIIIL